MAKHLISSTRTIEAMKADKHRLSDGDGLYPGGHPNCPTYGHPNCSTWPG
jgi:hypothetical protein